MKIKPDTYMALNPRQRALAALEAMKRKDDAELERLKETCPKFSYQMRDYEYTNLMNEIVNHSIAVELDIVVQVLKYCWFEHDMFLETAKAIEAGWDGILDAIEIDRELVKAAVTPRDELIDNILKRAPHADPELVKRIRPLMAKHMDSSIAPAAFKKLLAESEEAHGKQ